MCVCVCVCVCFQYACKLGTYILLYSTSSLPLQVASLDLERCRDGVTLCMPCLACTLISLQLVSVVSTSDHIWEKGSFYTCVLFATIVHSKGRCNSGMHLSVLANKSVTTTAFTMCQGQPIQTVCGYLIYLYHYTGTVYFQQTQPFLILSGFCVYSVASALLMFPALYGYFSRALDIYTFERADSAGRASDLVIQPFVRFISMAFFPVIICAGVLYMLVRSILLQILSLNIYLSVYLCFLFTDGQQITLGLPGVYTSCCGECCPQSSLDSSSDMAYSDIPPKGHSALSSHFSCSWFHQWLLYTHQ